MLGASAAAALDHEPLQPPRNKCLAEYAERRPDVYGYAYLLIDNNCTYKHAWVETHTDMHKYLHTYVPTFRTYIHTSRHTDMQTYKCADIQ